mgnify:CR=1 FL=1
MSFNKSLDNYGAVHPANTDNVPNEDRDRQQLLKQQEGQNTFVPIEEVSDPEAEAKIYDNIQDSLDADASKLDADRFGFIAQMQDLLVKVPDTDREKFLDKSVEFLTKYQQIIKKNIDSKKAEKEAQDIFDKIFGKQLLSYDPVSGEEEMTLHTTDFVKVTNKKAPVLGFRPEYNAKGQAIDPDVKTEKPKKTKKLHSLVSNLKIKWR